MKFGLSLLPLLFISLTHATPQTCISSTSEYTAQKDKLPSVFHELPVMLTTDSFLVTAALKIRTVGDRIKLEGHVWKPSEIYSDDSYVKTICYGGDSFKVTLENGQSYNAQMKDSDVSISGFTFKKNTDSGFAGIVEKVKGAIDKKQKAAAQKGTQ